MMERLSLEYSFLVFIAVTGILQLAAAHNNLRGLSFFKHKAYGYIFAVPIEIASLAALFTWNNRNATGIIQGSEQAGLFVLSVIIAVVCTIVVSSLLNRSHLSHIKSHLEGLEALKEMTYFQALRNLFRRRM